MLCMLRGWGICVAGKGLLFLDARAAQRRSFGSCKSHPLLQVDFSFGICLYCCSEAAFAHRRVIDPRGAKPPGGSEKALPPGPPRVLSELYSRLHSLAARCRGSPEFPLSAEAILCIIAASLPLFVARQPHSSLANRSLPLPLRGMRAQHATPSEAVSPVPHRRGSSTRLSGPLPLPPKGKTSPGDARTP